MPSVSVDVKQNFTLSNANIVIPLELPSLLKDYTKAVLREQPSDLIEFSITYFLALAAAKDKSASFRRNEANVGSAKAKLALQQDGGGRESVVNGVDESDTNDEAEITKDLILQLCDKLTINRASVDYALLEKHWLELKLPKQRLLDFLTVGDLFAEQVDFIKFIAIVAGTVTSNLAETMELLTTAFDGLQRGKFLEVFRFMADLDGEISASVIEAVEEFVKSHLDEDDDVTPSLFREADCPPFQ